MKIVTLFLAASLFTQVAMAEQFNYETGLKYNHAEQKFVTSFGGGNVSRQSSESDGYALSGTWYFLGLSDDGGPRSEAAFLSRASSLGISFGQDDAESEFTSPLFDASNPSELGILRQASSLESDFFSANARYVWKQSGWYGLASVSRAESKSSFESGGIPFVIDSDSSTFSVGAGKYVGKATAVNFIVGSLDAGGSATTTYSLAMTQVGAIGQTWQYGLDAGFSQSDADGDYGTASIGLSLFPTNDFEFGIALGYSDSKFVGGESYTAFASWFVNPSVGLTASYTQSEIETSQLTDADGNSFGVGVRVRL